MYMDNILRLLFTLQKQMYGIFRKNQKVSEQ